MVLPYNIHHVAIAVPDLDEAIAFTEKYGSHHSDSIITHDTAAAERYLAEVDSACARVLAMRRHVLPHRGATT